MGYWHGLYDDDLFNVLNKCDFSFAGVKEITLSDDCKAGLARFNDLTSQINGYDVYGKCWKTSDLMQMYETNSDFGLMKLGNEIKAYKKFFTQADYTPWVKRLQSYSSK